MSKSSSAASSASGAQGGLAQQQADAAGAVAAASFGPELERVPGPRRAALLARAVALRHLRALESMPLLSGAALEAQ